MMTNRVYSLTVILEDEIREDDAQDIINAIKMIKGVVDVTWPLVADSLYYAAKIKARNELGEKILNIIYPDKKS